MKVNKLQIYTAFAALCVFILLSCQNDGGASDALGAVILTEPANGAVNVPTAPTFRWTC